VLCVHHFCNVHCCKRFATSLQLRGVFQLTTFYFARATLGNLGLMYAYGVGIEKDAAKAIEWLHKAANQGDIVAMNDLAVFYDDGIGGKKDHVSVLLGHTVSPTVNACGLHPFFHRQCLWATRFHLQFLFLHALLLECLFVCVSTTTRCSAFMPRFVTIFAVLRAYISFT
jgi:hypothetical protein